MQENTPIRIPFNLKIRLNGQEMDDPMVIIERLAEALGLRFEINGEDHDIRKLLRDFTDRNRAGEKQVLRVHGPKLELEIEEERKIQAQRPLLDDRSRLYFKILLWCLFAVFFLLPVIVILIDIIRPGIL